MNEVKSKNLKSNENSNKGNIDISKINDESQISNK